MKTRKAAMEMSVGTLVTIVLLMVVLVLGIVLIRTIFKSGTNAVNEIDAQVQDQINKLFADEATKFVVYPPSREISIAQGDSAGVGFSIRNVESENTKTFRYVTAVKDTEKARVRRDCNINNPENLLLLGGSEEGIKIPSGNKMETAKLIRFDIPKTTPLCIIRYIITVTCIDCDQRDYGSTDFDLKIVS